MTFKHISVPAASHHSRLPQTKTDRGEALLIPMKNISNKSLALTAGGGKVTDNQIPFSSMYLFLLVCLFQ